MRQLVAILFADMTGYTAMMQENETRARDSRRKLKSVLDESILKFRGKTLQYYGDGSLSIFNSAIDAVNSALNMQHLLLEAPKVDVRMGIHIGDLIIEEEAIYGDGVNIASRIESLAAPGSILVSDKVFDEIKNQEAIKSVELGYFELKNVKQPIRVHAISNFGVVVPSRESMKGKTSSPSNRLAVLPFVNMSADPENEYFSDGITEELLNSLTKVDGLQVTSRTSVFAFKGKNDDIRDIAIQLNVDKILEGSVRKSGNRVRITAQLINAADGYHIWSENYDRDLTDIFDVQDEISGIIANRLRENLIGAKPQAKFSVKNIKAYTSYLKGLHYRNKLTPADARTAIKFFEDAIATDPHYALAYAMIAEAYSYLGSTGQMSPHKAFDLVNENADKALQLDDSIAEGYVAKASRLLYYEWKWKEAFDALKTAMELNPGSIPVYKMLGYYYITMGQKQDAVSILEEAVQIDPLSAALNQGLGNTYIFVERYDDAIAQAEKVLELEPGMRIGIELKAWGTGLKGDWKEALELFLEVHRLTNHPLKGLMGVGFALGKLGRKEEALECIQKVEERQRQEPDVVLDGDLVGMYFAIGDFDKVFYHLERCVERRAAPINFFLEYPVFKELKSDPRFLDLKRKQL
ncbi:MAG TPA: tetratricopeptide repeat protein [Chryseolinea sp.]|nr:tetratricopeptide repeat protein [Chryseolinea sp.]